MTINLPLQLPLVLAIAEKNIKKIIDSFNHGAQLDPFILYILKDAGLLEIILSFPSIQQLALPSESLYEYIADYIIGLSWLGDLDDSHMSYLRNSNLNQQAEALHATQKQGIIIKTYIENLMAQGFTVQNVPKDGSCFYHAIALQLIAANIRNSEGEFYTHEQLRYTAAAYFAAHTDDYFVQLVAVAEDHREALHNNIYQELLNGNTEIYLQLIFNNNFHADDITINALANALHININIYDINRPNNNQIIATEEPLSTVDVLYIGNHYLSLIHGRTEGGFIPYQPPIESMHNNHSAPSSSDNSVIELQSVAGIDFTCYSKYFD